MKNHIYHLVINHSDKFIWLNSVLGQQYMDFFQAISVNTFYDTFLRPN